MTTIGFAEQFYTLWDVMETPIYTDRGVQCGIERHCAFIKNISKSLDKVKELYPDTPIDENLHGHHSFSEKTYFPKEEYTDFTVFPYGKYRNQKIAECSDINYLIWFISSTSYRQYIDEAMKVLSNHGYMKFEGRVISVEEYNERMRHQERIKNLVSTLLAKQPFEIEFESNLNFDGTYEVISDFKDGIKTRYIIAFNDFKTSSYRGYDYHIPMVNGKGKRIKNKRFSIDDYSVVHYDAPHEKSYLDFTGRGWADESTYFYNMDNDEHRVYIVVNKFSSVK